MIRVLVVDDHPLFRNGLTALLETVPDVVVVGDAGDGDAAVSRAIELQPDVVLMDLNLPGTPGLEATRRIVAAAPGSAVLVVTMLADDASIAAAMRVGARCYVLKEAGQDEVLAAIRTVAAGGAVFGPGVAARLLERGPAGRDLTPREAEVLALVSRGRSNAEIARELVLSEQTVKTHVKRMLAKLGLRDRVQAVVLAYEAGLVRVGER
jgi:DNA-binding NarL/FixJ family response regulator